MKKIYMVFISIIILEISIFLFSSVFLTRGCGSPCDTHSLLNPFGYGTKGTACATICLPNAPHPLTYIMVDLFILTIIIYFTHLMVNKLKE